MDNGNSDSEDESVGLDFRSLGEKANKGTLGHMSSAKNHVTNLLKLKKGVYKSYQEIPSSDIAAEVANTAFFGSYVTYLLTYESSSIKKKKLALSTVTNLISGKLYVLFMSALCISLCK